MMEFKLKLSEYKYKRYNLDTLIPSWLSSCQRYEEIDKKQCNNKWVYWIEKWILILWVGSDI